MIRSRTPFLLPLVLFLFSPVVAQRQERLIDTWKPLHYAVSLSFDNQLNTIQTATTKVRAVLLKDSVAAIDLDFGELTIDAVGVNGLPARFERHPKRLIVTLNQPGRKGEQVEVTIKYHGVPKDGLILSADRDGKPSATGDNWPDRVHNWIPSLDHPAAKATVAFTITAPSRDLVVANGAFEGAQGNFGGTTTWSFKETKPIPPYCMVIIVNEGAKLDVPGSLTPLSYYVPQVDRAYAMQGFSSAPSALVFFSQIVAPYPYEKLALIVGATQFGGMENSSAIVFGSSLFERRQTPEPMSARFGIPKRIESLVAHEIAHQWFGDSVTQSTWADLWLSEGFATYFAGLFIERYEGEPAFRAYMKQAAETALAYEKRNRTPIFDRDTADLFKLLNANNYQKGAWVLHMLRRQLGDEAFFRGVRAYYNSHQHATATTEDLRRALEKASGKNLSEFFARWVYGSGHPRYKLTWGSAEFAGAGSSLVVTLQQTQADQPFLDPVPIEVVSGGAKHRFMIQPQGKLTVKSFPLKQPPTAVTLDPDETLLKEVISTRK